MDIKTGDVYYLDGDGAVWQATSYESENGVVYTVNELIEPAIEVE